LPAAGDYAQAEREQRAAMERAPALPAYREQWQRITERWAASG